MIHPTAAADAAGKPNATITIRASWSRSPPALDHLVLLRRAGLRRALSLDRRPDRRGGGALHDQLPESAPRGAVRAPLAPHETRDFPAVGPVDQDQDQRVVAGARDREQ